MKNRITLFFQCGLLFGLSAITVAQTSKPVPTLTTDDVVISRPTSPVSAPPAKETSKNTGKEEKSAVPDAPKSASSASEDSQKKAERDWNDRLKKAQEKARGLESQADQAELTITQLRNQLYSAAARTPEANGQINARMNELSTQMNRLRAEAQVAQQEIEALRTEGNEKQYKEQFVALTNEKGEPNVEAYKSENDKLESELQAARARVEVLQFRLNSNHSEVLKKGNADNFTLNRLRQEKEQTSAELEATRARIETLTSQIQTHRQKAAASGVQLNVR
ncbi:MAG: hypothetical protein JST84_01270 [Acidobacteria bacterium]|nr:hypothetical protein [Acidobacteriota bacterium]